MKKIMYSISDLNNFSFEELSKKFGERTATLLQLHNEIGEGVVVPNFAVVPVDVSKSLNVLTEYTNPDMHVFDHWVRSNSILSNLMHDSRNIFGSEIPIMRGTSSLEGHSKLSFAGVCKSYIPSSSKSLQENFQGGILTTLTSSYGMYGKYYFNVHNLPMSGHDIGQIFMSFVQNPLVHLTAYVFASHYFLRGFIQPVDRNFSGGFDLVIEKDHDRVIASLPGSQEDCVQNVWKRLLVFLDSQYEHFYGTPSSIDMELLISGSWSSATIVPVQIRRVTDQFREIVTLSTASKSLGQSMFTVKSGHLPFSVGTFSGKLVMFKNGLVCSDDVIYVIQHKDGKGSLDFLTSIFLSDQNINIIVLHDNDSGHDHLQYAMYEDPRISGIFHVKSDISTFLNKEVKIISSGYSLSIQEI